MSVVAEAGQNLSAAFGMLRRDPAAIGRFVQTQDSLRRSFFSFVIIIPVWLGFNATTIPPEGVDLPAPEILLTVQFLSLVTGWMAFPAAMMFMARSVVRPERVYNYVIARNWGEVVVNLFTLPAVALSGITSGQVNPLGVFLAAGVSFWTLYYRWWIARNALGVQGIPAAGFVILDILISITLSIALANLFGLNVSPTGDSAS